MDIERLERLYQEGKIPDRYYYQMNGKSAEENYRRIKISKKKNYNFFLEIMKASMRAVI